MSDTKKEIAELEAAKVLTQLQEGKLPGPMDANAAAALLDFISQDDPIEGEMFTKFFGKTREELWKEE